MATKAKIEDQRKWNLVSKKRTNDELYKDATEGVDYVVCKECGLKASQMSKHVQTCHNLTPDEYYTKHSCDRSALMSLKYLTQLTNRALTKNPSKDHGGKFSAHSPKFFKYQGLSEDEVAAKIAAVKAYTSLKRTEIPSNTTIEYWLERTNGNLDEAKKLQSNRQSTFSLEKCIAKYGEVEGRVKWSDRQEKWLKSVQKVQKFGFSKIANEFVSRLPESSNTFSSNYNREFLIKVWDTAAKRQRIIKPDYLDTKTNKIIEFYGDYYHANPAIYTAEQYFTNIGSKYKEGCTAKEMWDKDIQRIGWLDQLGYKVHIVWENDYRTDPVKVINECLTFLTN